MKLIRYIAIAALLGVLWYFILLSSGSGLPLGVPHGPDSGTLAMMVAASVTVAVLFRRSISMASGARFHVLALVLPGVCSLIFGVYLVAFLWFMTFLEPGTGLSAGILLMPLYCLIFGAWALFPITVPMGYLSQWSMRLAGRSTVRSDQA